MLLLFAKNGLKSNFWQIMGVIICQKLNILVFLAKNKL
jgi:hypothetical protein